MPDKFKIALIGEAYGEEEDQWKMPFVGNAGKALDSLLEDAGINRKECFVTNVFNFRPGTAAKSFAANQNDLGLICGSKGEPDVAPGLSALIPGKYLKAQYLPEVDRLVAELSDCRPNVAVLLGNTACWALLGQQAISKIRGTCAISTRVPGLKCLPTYHPAAIFKQPDIRYVTVLDLIKAKREGEFPDLRRPKRTIHVAQSIEDIMEFKVLYLDRSRRKVLDIETALGQITCIGFAPSVDRALVIPIIDVRRPNASYWAELDTEVKVWDLIAEIVGNPQDEWIGQNGLYDLQYLWQFYGIPVPGYKHDTMILHHSLQPEAPKKLDYLGSIYTNETAWKKERPRGGDQTIKREA